MLERAPTAQLVSARLRATRLEWKDAAERRHERPKRAGALDWPKRRRRRATAEKGFLFGIKISHLLGPPSWAAAQVRLATAADDSPEDEEHCEETKNHVYGLSVRPELSQASAVEMPGQREPWLAGRRSKSRLDPARGLDDHLAERPADGRVADCVD